MGNVESTGRWFGRTKARWPSRRGDFSKWTPGRLRDFYPVTSMSWLLGIAKWSKDEISNKKKFIILRSEFSKWSWLNSKFAVAMINARSNCVSEKAAKSIRESIPRREVAMEIGWIVWYIFGSHGSSSPFRATIMELYPITPCHWMNTRPIKENI